MVVWSAGKPHNTESLPQWAKTYIDYLARRTAALEKQLDTTPDRTNIEVRRDAAEVPVKYLEDTDTIRFRVGPKNWFDYITVGRTDEGSIEVWGGDRLAITPVASNKVKIKLIDRS